MPNPHLSPVSVIPKAVLKYKIYLSSKQVLQNLCILVLSQLSFNAQLLGGISYLLFIPFF